MGTIQPKHGLVLALTLLLSACGGGGGGATTAAPTGTDTGTGTGTGTGTNPLTAATAEPAGANCPRGGFKIDAGSDVNGDGTLAADEVASTQYACNPATAVALSSNGLTTLVQMLDDTGSHCEAGGKAIHVGLDNNRNNALDSDEVTSTGYVCNGINGDPGADGANGVNGLVTLISIDDVGPGEGGCRDGGNRISTGSDLDADGTLDLAPAAGEVTSTSYVCNGARGDLLRPVVVTNALEEVRVEADTRYIAYGEEARVIIRLPLDPVPIGSRVSVKGAGAPGWAIVPNVTQVVRMGALSTTPGTGSISGGASDFVDLIHIGNGVFDVLSHEGNLTIQ